MNAETVTITIPEGMTAGSGETRQSVSGRFAGVSIQYEGQPETCRVAITEVETGETIITITGNVDDLYAPRHQAQDDAGADVDWLIDFPVNSHLAVEASNGAAGSISAQIRWIST